MRIAVLSLADINNYGDTFFPYIFRAELLKRMPESEIELITNTEYDCGLYRTKAYSREYLSEFDAVILAGGETVARLDEEEWNGIYGNVSAGGYKGHPSDIAFGWLDLEKPFKAWFSVGVHPIMAERSEDITRAKNGLDYITVRGILSKKILDENLTVNNDNIRVVPDLGWGFCDYIDMGNAPLPALLRDNYAVFETYRTDEKKLKFIANALVEFQKFSSVQIVLLPIIHTKSDIDSLSWDDQKYLRKIQQFSDYGLTLLPDTLSVLEIGNILKHCKFFVGSSMHGAVTALAYGKPAVSIHEWAAPKLQDLYAARYRSACFANDWSVLPGVLERLNNESENETDKRYALMYADYMRYRLSREIDNLVSKLNEFNGKRSVHSESANARFTHMRLTQSEQLKSFLLEERKECDIDGACPIPFFHPHIVEENGEIAVYSCAPPDDAITAGILARGKAFESVWNSEANDAVRQKVKSGEFTDCQLLTCATEGRYAAFYDYFRRIKHETGKNPLVVKFMHDFECNYHCVMCRKEVRVREINELERLKDKIESVLLPMCKNADAVYFAGNGDPFASRHYRALIKAIADAYPHIKFILHTNGSLLTEANCVKLGIENRIDSVMISVNAATETTYEKISPGASWGRLLRNIEFVNDYMEKGKINALHFSLIVLKENYLEMPDFVAFSRAHNAKCRFTLCHPEPFSALDYDATTVFDPRHPDFLAYRKMLENPIFDWDGCYLDPYSKWLRECN